MWFTTNAFIEYMRLLGLDSYCKIVEYKEATKDDPIQSYPEYLVINYNNFFTRMISCPKCICIQLSAVINLPIFAVLSLLSFKFFLVSWLLFPISVLVTAYFGLLMYFILGRIMRQ